MADRYCDHGAYPAYAATPTWATPQEGDGSGTGTGASAIGSVVFSQGHTAGSVAVFGASVTPAASSSADDAANKLATAINAATTTISTTFSGGPTATQLRDVVFARGPSGGAPAGTCQIMTRVASSLLNDGGGNTSLTQAGFDGTAPTLTQFSGGASGVWGYFINDAALWPSGKAALTYTVLVPSSLLVGSAPTSADILNIRAQNNECVINMSSLNGGLTCTIAARVLLDDGTIWPGSDGNTFTVRITGASGSTRSLTFQGSLAMGARTPGKFVFRSEHAGFCPIVFQSTTGYMDFDGLTWRITAAADTNAPILMKIRSSNQAMYFRRGFLVSEKTTALVGFMDVATDNTFNNSSISFEGCVFDYSAYVGSSVSVVPSGMSGNGNTQLIAIRDCSFICSVPLFATSNFSGQGKLLLLDNVSGLTIGNNSGIFGTYMQNEGDSAGHNRAIFTNIGNDKSFRYESRNVLVEWISGAGFPYLDSTLPNNTYWSYSILWGQLPAGARVHVLKLVSTVAASGVTTATIRLLLPSTIASAVGKRQIVVRISYRDSSGVTKTDWSGLPWDTSALSTTSDSWTLNSYTSHAARKVAVTLSSTPAVGSDVAADLYLVGPANGGVTQRLFVDPTLVLA